MTQRNVEQLNPLGNALEAEHGDVLREFLAETLRVFMEVEVSELCGASRGERSSARTNHRDGYRPRPFETRLGSLEDLVEAMGAKGMSKSEASRMAAVLDEQVTALRERPLGEMAMPYLGSTRGT